MINEKIQNLLKELHDECEKEGVAGICTLTKKGKATTMLTGNLPDVAFCLAIQERSFDAGLPIPTRILRDAGLKAMDITDKESEKESSFDRPKNDSNDSQYIFDQFFGGDKRDDD